MKNGKRFIVLGLGSFGTALATRLAKNGCRVTGVDTCEARVEALKDVLHEAVVGDVTDRGTLEELLVSQANAVFISLGEKIEMSLLAALHAREAGAKRVLVKGVTDEHGRILKHLGVERVVFPEAEMAEQLADAITWPNVLDALVIDADHSLVEIAVPTAFAGQSLRQVDLRRRFGCLVLGVKDHLTGNLTLNPDGEYKLTDDQILLVIGRKTDLNRLGDIR
ncbi:MAG TPA: TrkA family potassium uptake protein [Pirellulales bacterium]|nr:TrkA family potassium uptake protein [Pirellulales bacterium]